MSSSLKALKSNDGKQKKKHARKQSSHEERSSSIEALENIDEKQGGNR